MRSRTAMPFLAALAVLAGGCSGGSEKATVLPSITASPTPTALVASVPPAAQANTRVGAGEFVKYWFSLLDEAYQKGVAFPDGLDDPKCTACANFEGVADRLALAGDHFTSATFANLTAAAPPLGPALIDVAFACDQPARVRVHSDGSVVKAFPQRPKLRFTVFVTRAGSGWRMREIEKPE